MNNSKKRIFMCGIHQESNCFNPIPTPVGMFNIVDGCNAWKGFINSKTSTGGVVATLEAEKDVEVIYSTVMRAPSGAPLEASVAEGFLKTVLTDLKAAGKLDGVALSLHGATMSEVSDDVCGDVIEAIRKEIGEDIPLSAAFDLHANITE